MKHIPKLFETPQEIKEKSNITLFTQPMEKLSEILGVNLIHYEFVNCCIIILCSLFLYYDNSF